MNRKNYIPRISCLWLFAGLTLSLAGSITPPDPSVWQMFLSKYVDTTATDGLYRVRYRSVTAGDMAGLQGYLNLLQSTLASSLSKPDERAFWINLYNAKTVAVVLDHYPIKSVRDIKLPGSTATGPWDAKVLKVEGKALSLNDIENGILRIRWKDNRIHFALNCASIGCPNLPHQAFTASNTEKLLEAGAKAFLKSNRAVTMVEGKVKLSSIFEWYRADFGATEKEVLIFLSRSVPPELSVQLANWKGKIEYFYDWNLNEL